METVSKKTLMLFAGQGNEDLSREIAECIGSPLGDVKLSTFASGELYARYGESIRGADVFVVQSHCEPINDRIMQQLLMIDAAKRAVGVPDHRGVSVLRLRPAGPEGRRPRADLGAVCSPTCSRSRAPIASSPSTSTPGRSRASSTVRSTT